VDRPGASFGDDLLQEIGQSFLVLKDFLPAFDFVVERHAHAFVDVADHFKAFPNERRIEFDLRKNRRIGVEVNRRPRPARRTGFLERSGGFPALERHLPRRAIALDARAQLR
jgi:hypothetical protein